MFEEPSTIPTYLWVDAKLRALSAQGIGVYVAHRGEKMGGLILLKLANMSGQCKLLTQQRDIDGVLGWQNVFQEVLVDESRADEYSACLLYTSPSPRDRQKSRMPSSA